VRIAIVGGGATGVLAATHLAARDRSGSDQIVVIDPSDELGRGIAYSTQDPRHLLNVRAANMSAFAERPQHFCDWIEAREAEKGPRPFAFVSRWTYGDYVADLARDLLAGRRITHLRETCVNLIETDREARLQLASGATIGADVVVLATGHDAKPALTGIPAEQPWTEASLAGVDPHAPLLIVGSGLTMVDMALSLDRRGHHGPIFVVSRRGLLPTGHRPVAPRTLSAAEVPFGAPLSKLVRWLRALVAAQGEDGGDWRGAFDALRPHTQRLWGAMTLDQRRRFLRHARPYWDVHRHRMAPEIERKLADLIHARGLIVIPGRFAGAAALGANIAVEVRARGSGETKTIEVARVIDCTGLPDDPTKSANPLIRALLAQGAARVDALGIGLDVADDFALIDRRGRSSQRVRALGPLARAAFWECIAIPDIRVQCQQLADSLALSAARVAEGVSPSQL